MSEAVSSAPVDASPISSVPFVDLAVQHRETADDVRAAVERVFAEQAFILGDEVAELECDIAEYCDSRDAVGCGSGTDALILALTALNIGPGDEVITTPFTFFATASAIHLVGARPVFVDIDPVSFNIDPAAVEAAVTDATRAIIPVHLFGQCAEMEPLWRIAVRSGLAVIEDACQAIGAEYRGRRAGVLGTLGCFSFFPTKNLGGAGDGGLLTTDDTELARRLRQLRVHGDVGGYQHEEIGYNSRLDALQAAVLRARFPHLESWTEQRQANAARYDELFRDYQLLDAVELPTVLPDRRHVFNQYCIRVRGGRRDALRQELRRRDVGCGVYYPRPLHLQRCFEYLDYQPGEFPEAEAAADEVLALPIYPGLQPEQQEFVVQSIAAALGRDSASASRSLDTSSRAA